MREKQGVSKHKNNITLRVNKTKQKLKQNMNRLGKIVLYLKKKLKKAFSVVENFV